MENLISFKRLRAKVQHVVRNAKRTVCEAFVSSLSRSARSDIVWNKLWRMSDKCNRTTIPGISVGGATTTSQADIANTIASCFSTICSSDNDFPSFKVIKYNADTLPLDFTPRVAESYNAIFSMDELLAALDRCRNTSTGPDGIHNQMLSHLPPAGREFLLSMYNRK
jgi:hypothetical protein